MKFIQSKENKLFKQYKNLNKRKNRDIFNQYLVEGERFVDDAIQKNQSIECIISNYKFSESMQRYSQFEQIVFDDTLFNEISDTINSQGIIAVINKDKTKEIDYTKPMIILDQLQDPGNMGTIIRTAVSAGINNIITIKGSVDIYNPKVVRSTAGAIFNINHLEINDIDSFFMKLKKEEYQIISTKMDAEIAFNDCTYVNKTAVIIGNEGNGISDGILVYSDFSVKIPLYGDIESLNASVAAAIVIYEVGKQLNK
ncbi:MAG: RNA methyltransferase [Clostridiales bacterium]|nr:RNA methyltransferase [Clostridiales bacterium]